VFTFFNPFTADPVKALHFAILQWSNPPFLIFDIRALWRSGLSARVPECQKLKMAESSKHQKFGTAGVAGVDVEWESHHGKSPVWDDC